MSTEVEEVLIHLNKWRKNVTGQLSLISDSKSGVKFKVQDEKGNSIDMPEKHIEGFKMGIALALELINDTFPIKQNNDNN